MNRSDLIAAFQDTVAFSESDILREKTAQAAASSKVYLENFQAHSHPEGHSATISVEEDTTFSAAKRYFVAGKTAVLNFANPVTPGGGAQNGVMAQEECLCRSSNLYVCLTSSPFLDYYQYNRSLHSHFYSDRIIYTKGVAVFKTDDEIPVLMPERDWFQVDVITCSAPYIAKRKYTNRTALKSLFKSRIKNIFEVAIGNGVTTLILGAFGCGAFKNPPELVAAAFYETIHENRYTEQFDRIVFAIRKSGDNVNYHAFSETFCPLSVNCPEYTLDEIRLPSGKTITGTTVGFANTPRNMTLGTVKEWIAKGIGYPIGRLGVSHVTPDEKEKYIRYTEFVKWQVQNPFYKKQFSILGDSISTLDGYNPKGYNLFYTAEACDRTGVHERQDTWWGKVIDYFGGELLVNNSWSGSRVTKLPNRDTLFPSGCSNERTGGLHIGEVMPDVIIVYLGTNDWACGASVEAEQKKYGENDAFFAFAYCDMLDKVKRNYPNAEVFCCTLNETYMSAKPAFRFPYSYGGIHIEKYNAAVRNAAKRAGCRVIELFNKHIPYDATDGTHPTAAGMNTLATLMLRGMCDSDGTAFLNCEGEHDFIAVDKHIGGSKKVCRKCGLEQNRNRFFSSENKKSNQTTDIAPKGKNMMQVTQCSNGHFFDRDKYIHCPYCGIDVWDKAKQHDPEIDNTKSDFLREALETSTLSETFASGAVFDISRQQHEIFEGIVRSGNADNLLKWFVAAYRLFCENPAIVNLPPSMAGEDKHDVRITEMNADIFTLSNGNRAALCFMPIQNDILAARIMGIILSDTGDRYYYCMLKKDETALSEVFRNKALQGIEKVGTINGFGFELMNSFLDCMEKDFFEAIQPKHVPDIVDLHPNCTTMLYSEDMGLRLFDESAQKNVIIKKSKILIGKDSSCDLKLTEYFVSRIHAEFILHNTSWLLRDCGSTNGTWLNDTKLEPDKKYVLYPGDVIDLAHREKFVFFKSYMSHEDSPLHLEEKSVSILESSLKAFHDTGSKDETIFKLIIAALIDLPLYLPVAMDLNAMFGDLDPTKLKPGDVIQAKQDVRSKILTITVEEQEFVPLFTSSEEMNKGPSVSSMRMHPQDYLPRLIAMGHDAIINPFGGHAFFVGQKMMKELLLPLVVSRTTEDKKAEQMQSKSGKWEGKTIQDRYQIKTLIGQGGMSEAYLAEDMRCMNQPVTVVTNRKDVGNGIVRTVVMQEAHLMMRFNHPAIPKVFDLVEEDQQLFIIREYIDGVTLSQKIKMDGLFSEQAAIDIGRRIAAVLNYIHTFDPPYIYRDVKPENVMLKKTGEIKLIDFEIAMPYRAGVDNNSDHLGTFGYAAPEQYGGQGAIDPRADIYGLGMTLYHMLTGIAPGKSISEIPPIRQANPAVSAGMEYIVNRCTSIKREDRYANCMELIKDLNDVQHLPPKKGFLESLLGKGKKAKRSFES